MKLTPVIYPLLLASTGFLHAADPAKPNIVVILADDLGYADPGCYHQGAIKTPNLDRMAAKGIRLTDFHTPATVCSPSRAALLTGCYPKRVDMHVTVLPPKSQRGLNPGEVTLAELLKGQGYATMCIGKWHLGENPAILPTAQGFDHYYGMPGPNHGASDLLRDAVTIKANKDVKREDITQDYTREAKEFITSHKDRPFFLYLAHSAVHIPLYASAAFQGHSQAGIYGDMTEELDWSCGEVIKTLEESGIINQTLVIFTSDNGPSGVDAAPLHGGKGSCWEGGHREPFIAQWPGKIPPASVSHAMATMMDILPTIAPLTGAKVPTDRTIDGHDIWPQLTGRSDKSATTFMCYYNRPGNLSAIRDGKWKLHLLVPEEKWAGKLPPTALLDTKPKTPPPWLYDLEADIGETKDVAAANPQIVKRMLQLANDFDAKLDAGMRPQFNAEGKGAAKKKKAE